MERQSLKSKPGAMKRKEKLERGERGEKFGEIWRLLWGRCKEGRRWRLRGHRGQ